MMKVIENNQGPWNDWEQLVSSQQWQHTVHEHGSEFEQISKAFKSDNLEAVYSSNALNTTQKINLLQVLYMSNKRKDSTMPTEHEGTLLQNADRKKLYS